MFVANLLGFSMNKNSYTFLELPQDAIARYGRGIVCDLAVSADETYLAVVVL